MKRLCCLAVAGLLVLTGAARAQESNEDLKRKVDALEKRVQELEAKGQQAGAPAAANKQLEDRVAKLEEKWAAPDTLRA